MVGHQAEGLVRTFSKRLLEVKEWEAGWQQRVHGGLERARSRAAHSLSPPPGTWPTQYSPQLHSFPSVVMRRLCAAQDPETTVRTRTPDRHPYLCGPHKF